MTSNCPKQVSSDVRHALHYFNNPEKEKEINAVLEDIVFDRSEIVIPEEKEIEVTPKTLKVDVTNKNVG